MQLVNSAREINDILEEQFGNCISTETIGLGTSGDTELENRPVTCDNVCEGRKDLLGMYISKSDEINSCLGVFTDLQNSGVHDILITCVDGLKGFPWCNCKCLPSDYGPALHRAPDTQLGQVCGQQESEGVRAGP